MVGTVAGQRETLVLRLPTVAVSSNEGQTTKAANSFRPATLSKLESGAMATPAAGDGSGPSRKKVRTAPPAADAGDDHDATMLDEAAAAATARSTSGTLSGKARNIVTPGEAITSSDSGFMRYGDDGRRHRQRTVA